MGAVERMAKYELDRVPQPLAENLDQDLARAALRKYERKKTPSGIIRSAWSYAEYALNTNMTRSEEREEYFRSSQYLTSLVIGHQEAHQDIVLNALTLSTYLPLFEKRANDVDLTRRDCEAVYASLGRAIQYLRPLSIEEPPQWRMTEISMLALSARARQPHLLMYPTSPREEMSGVASLNHDSYFFDWQGKIPIQQKILPTGKSYDECIKILTVQPLLDLALRKAKGGDSVVTLADKVNYLLSLVVAETSGEKLARGEVQFLNTMTEAVVAHYFEASKERSELAA